MQMQNNNMYLTKEEEAKKKYANITQNCMDLL